MTTAAIHFYASDFCQEGFEYFVRDGLVVGAAGTINLLWEDFSAVDVAAEIGLSQVAWDAVRDSSPGDLTLTVHYPALTLTQVEQRLRGQDWIGDCEFLPPLTLHHYT